MKAKRTLTELVAAVTLIAFCGSCAPAQQNTAQGVATQSTPAGEPWAIPRPVGQYPDQQDVQLGQQAAQQADQQLPDLPASSPVSQYVSTIVQRLAKTLPQPTYPYNVKVVNVSDINAFALPGGPIRIFLGTIQAAQSEDQLAGVLAHEMSHVYLRHSDQQATKQTELQLPAAILGAVLGNSAAGQIARTGISLGLGGLMLKYSRDDEAQADAIGAKIMYAANYDPRAMAQFFEILQQKSGGERGSQLLQDHPNPGNRVQAVTQEIAGWPARQYQHDSAAFEQVHQQVARMKAPSMEQVQQQAQSQRPTVGQVPAAQVMPSGQYQQLNNNAFQIVYPSNWQVAQDNQNSGVVIAPQAGVTQNAIAYGVMISAFQPQGAQNLQQATSELVQNLQQSNPQLQVAGQPQSTNISGRQGISVYLTEPSPLQAGNGQPATERDMLVTVPRSDGSVLYVIFIAPDAQFQQLQPAFQRMLSSLRVS